MTALYEIYSCDLQIIDSEDMLLRKGLLPLLKSIHKPTHLRNFAGQTLGVDAYGWLHRGTVSCAIELAQQKPTRKHIEFTLNRVRMLIHFGVKPFLVFDGDYLPSKAHTEKERATRRRESKKAGLELLRMGRIPQAHLELQKAIDVTPLMARELIDELKRLDVPYIVAPYEADSQLAYLEKQGTISGILSEDSDLLVFGTKCLLTKLDQHGECVMINRADFTACREISLVGWTDKEFRMMTMLSGCDYLPGIDKMGLKTAYRLVRKHKVLDRVVRSVQFDGKMKVPAGYLDAFARAEHTFMYQWVYCTGTKGLVNLNRIPTDLNAAEMPYIGKYVEPDAATGVANGDLEPNTKQRLVVSSRHPPPLMRLRTVQTPDEKQGKSIAEFFKPSRTPLAELDPNSFTPSPSQQRLLESQQTAAWSASRVPAMRPPALVRASTNNTPSSAPQATRRSISTPFPAPSRASPKRQRLCSDSLLAASMEGSVGLQTAKSRFFSREPQQASPSLRKTSNQKKQDEFDLWSDDTRAEALAATDCAAQTTKTDAVSSPRKRKKLAVYVDPSMNVAGQDVSSADVSQDTTGTAFSTQSQPSASVKTADTSFESADSPPEPVTILTKGINASFAELKSKWTFAPGASRQSTTRTQSTPIRHQPRLQATRQESVHPRRIEANRPSVPVHVDKTSGAAAETLVPGSSPIAGAAEPRDCDEIPDEERLALEQREASPVLQIAAQGSEDLLVPESPSDEGDDGKHRRKLDLGRFAFSV